MGAISVSRTDRVATVTLDRPERMNAITNAMWIQLGEAVGALSTDDSLRCVVFRGAGTEAFASGADVTEFPEIRRNAAEARRYNAPLTRAVDLIGDCPHPTVAMIYGPCMGSALAIAARCDLRIAGRGARFGARISRLGSTMPLAEMQALVDLVGYEGAKEILIEGRILSSDDALRLAIVNRVVADEDLEAEVGAAVARIREGAPLVHRMHKKLLRKIASGETLTDAELGESYALCDTEDYKIGVAAFVAKQPPKFQGR